VRVRAEFTVEPFVAGRPGPHVTAAIDAAGTTGLAVDVGPFGSSLEGDADAVLAAVARVNAAALDAGAARVVAEVVRLDEEVT
jgi:uncharacterized protein YqgV (UPF0045/DUF77 family)